MEKAQPTTWIVGEVDGQVAIHPMYTDDEHKEASEQGVKVLEICGTREAAYKALNSIV